MSKTDTEKGPNLEYLARWREKELKVIGLAVEEVAEELDKENTDENNSSEDI